MRNKGKGHAGILQVLASCYFWVTLFLISGLLFPVAVLLFLTTVLFDRRRYLLHTFTCYWSDLILFINFYWKVQVEGREKIDPSTVYVIVSNHQSGLDILLLFKLHRHFKWVAKTSLFSIPFIGWNMSLNGYIPIERGRGRSKLRMMDRAAESVRQGNSVIIFPEGTRSPDGKLHPYKTGAFRLALETSTPVIPVVIEGTREAIKKGGLLISRSDRIKLSVLEPIPFETCRHMDSRGLASLVFDLTKKEFEART